MCLRYHIALWLKIYQHLTFLILSSPHIFKDFSGLYQFFGVPVASHYEHFHEILQSNVIQSLEDFSKASFYFL